MAGFFRQLRERKVCRAAAVYAIFSWVILQLGEIVFPVLGLPPWTLTLVVLVAVAGFPVAMILAWVLQWTDDGLVIDVPKSGDQAQNSPIDAVLNVALLSAAAILSAELVWENSVSDAQAEAGIIEYQESIAIVPFMGEDQIDDGDAHAIEQLLRYEMVSTQFPLQLVAGISRSEAFAPGGASVPLDWVVEGSVHNENGQIRLLLHLIELPGRRYVDAWSLTSNPDTPTAHRDLAKTAVATVIGKLRPVESGEMHSRLLDAATDGAQRGARERQEQT